MDQTLKELKLTDVKPNKLNFRQNFSGPAFDDLVESVRIKGVVQPILVRPVKGKVKYEVVFGECRRRAAAVVSKEKGGKKTIPAIIRQLSDSEAYDLMIIENLRRQDLTELEEAQGFKRFLDKNGNEALYDLAERSGIKAAYIRRRVSVLGLPQGVLEAWGRGDIAYGYLEQLARLDDETEILALFEDIMDGWEINSIKELKEIIDNQAVELDCALFDLKKEGCLACASNSDVQIKMFEIDAQRTKCLKTDCFKEKQVAWLNANWKKSAFHKKYKTSGYKFTNDADRNRCHIFHDKKYVGKPCPKCNAFVTIFSGAKLNVHFERVCVGEKSCFDKMFVQSEPSKEAKASNTTDEQGDQPRVAWHGEYFREAFFMETIPQRFEKVAPGQLHAAQLALFALIKSKWELTHWFMKKYAGHEEDCYGFSQQELFKLITDMTLQQVNDALKAATLQFMMYDDFSADARRLVAGHIGIDLAHEWVFTEEYLKKKHIAEILAMGARFGIFSDPKAKAYLADEIGKKKFESCRKKELISVFLDSGVDLSGKVPDEILSSL